jgi:tetratricopeptide (TPR) repeat protein
MTEPTSGDPVEGATPNEGLPVDGVQVRDSGLVAGGPVRMAGHNVAGRDLTSNVTGHNAAGRDLTIHQHFTSNSDIDAFIDERLPALPPPVREPIRRLRIQHRALAARLVGILADARATPDQTIRDLTSTPTPPWLAEPDTPVDALIAVAEFASAHGSYRAAAAIFARVADLGVPVRAVWLARAALTIVQAGDQEAAFAYLEHAEGLVGDGMPFVAAVRAALSNDAGGVLAAVGSRDIVALEPVEFAMLCANAYAAQGDRDTAIATFEALADRYPGLGGFALRAAQLRLERVVDSSSPGHASDVRQARQLALRARDARRTWRGDSAEAVVVACHAAMIAVDFNRALAYGLAAPAGEATAAEAMEPAVLECAATAAIALDQRDLAVQLINQLPDSAAQATLLGQLAERDPSTVEQARAAYHRAFNLATDDSQRLAIVQGLAELGEWPLPWLEELQSHAPEHAEYLTAMSEMARGRYDEAIRRLRPRQGASLMAAKLLAEVQRRAGRVEDSVQTLRAAARRFDDPHSLTGAAMTLFEAGRKREARTTAIEALSTTPADSPDRSQLRQLLRDEAAERHDWPAVEQQARAMLDEGATDPDVRWLLTMAVTNQGRIEDAWTIARQAPPLEATNEQQARLWLALHGRFASDAATVEQALELLGRYGQSEEFAAAAITTLIMMTRNATLPEPTVGRLQQATEAFFERFPSSVLLESITVDFDDPEAVLAEFRRRLEPGAAQYAEIRRHVVQGSFPVGMLAMAAGKTYTEALLHRAPGFLPAYPVDPTLAGQEQQLATDALDGTVIVEPSALYLASLIPEQWPHLLAAFAHVQIPDGSLRDILTAQDGLALRSTTSIGWNTEHERMVIAEISQADADQLAERATWMARTALSLEVMAVDALSQFPEMDREHTRSWLAPLELAKQQGVALLSDDLALRGLARSLGIPTFGSIAVLGALVAAGHLDTAARDAALLQFRRHWVVDLPFDAAQLRALAEADQWQPGPAYFALTRPATWRDRRQVLGFYRAGQQQIAATDPEHLPDWLSAAILGFAGGQPPMAVTPMAGLLLTLATLQANTDPAILAKLVPAARQAATELGGGDPLPQTVRDVAAVFIEALGHAEGARYALLHAFSALDPPDRLLAVRELVSQRS